MTPTLRLYPPVHEVEAARATGEVDLPEYVFADLDEREGLACALVALGRAVPSPPPFVEADRRLDAMARLTLAALLEVADARGVAPVDGLSARLGGLRDTTTVLERLQRLGWTRPHPRGVVVRLR